MLVTVHMLKPLVLLPRSTYDEDEGLKVQNVMLTVDLSHGFALFWSDAAACAYVTQALPTYLGHFFVLFSRVAAVCFLTFVYRSTLLVITC